MGAV
jgi:hypothetical protein